jgi:bis(5'-nucleosyl)-tetraphosphatase (symmetrical)
MHWLVGDVQGCALELERLLERVRFDPARDVLWSVGDLVNRGPESVQALSLWRDVGGRAVLGNHEVYALLCHSGRQPRKPDTLEPLFRAPDVDDLLRPLRELPLLVRVGRERDGREVWVVHAGLHPGWTDLPKTARRINAGPHDDAWLTGEAAKFATRVRCCDARGNRSRHKGAPEDCPDGYVAWDDLYAGEALIVHGHWAQRGFYRNERTMGLDSGCVYGGPLTAWCLEEDRVVQVPAR